MTLLHTFCTGFAPRMHLAAILLACLFIGACSNPPDLEPPGPAPDDPEPADHTMTTGQAYPLSANDRLVNTQPEPTRVNIVFELDENTEQTRAVISLQDGSADLLH